MGSIDYAMNAVARPFLELYSGVEILTWNVKPQVMKLKFGLNKFGRDTVQFKDQNTFLVTLPDQRYLSHILLKASFSPMSCPEMCE